MDVGNLLQFQCPLHGRGIVAASTEVEEVTGIGEYRSHRLDVFVLVEYLLDIVGHGYQTAQHFPILLLVDESFHLGQHHRHHDQYGDLSGKGFGGGYAYLRSDVDVGSGVCRTGYRRADHVAYAVDESPLAFGQLDGGQRICRFSGLRDGYHHVVGMDDRIPVAEFRRIFDLYLDAAEVFEEVFADEARVPRRTARHEDDSPGIEEPLLVVEDARQHHVRALHVDAAPDAVGNGTRLFEDFLEHEVRVTAFFELRDVHLQLADIDF